MIESTEAGTLYSLVSSAERLVPVLHQDSCSDEVQTEVRKILYDTYLKSWPLWVMVCSWLIGLVLFGYGLVQIERYRPETEAIVGDMNREVNEARSEIREARAEVAKEAAAARRIAESLEESLETRIQQEVRPVAIEALNGVLAREEIERLVEDRTDRYLMDVRHPIDERLVLLGKRLGRLEAEFAMAPVKEQNSESPWGFTTVFLFLCLLLLQTLALARIAWRRGGRHN